MEDAAGMYDSGPPPLRGAPIINMRDPEASSPPRVLR